MQKTGTDSVSAKYSSTSYGEHVRGSFKTSIGLGRSPSPFVANESLPDVPKD